MHYKEIPQRFHPQFGLEKIEALSIPNRVIWIQTMWY